LEYWPAIRVREKRRVFTRLRTAASKILLEVTNFKRPGGAIPVAFAIDGDALSCFQAGSSAGQFIHALVAFRDDGEPADEALLSADPQVVLQAEFAGDLRLSIALAYIGISAEGRAAGNIMPPYVPWPTNGFASCSAAGRIGSL
jgi:hypothetical protein